jgi:hypothetical protein
MKCSDNRKISQTNINFRKIKLDLSGSFIFRRNILRPTPGFLFATEWNEKNDENSIFGVMDWKD